MELTKCKVFGIVYRQVGMFTECRREEVFFSLQLRKEISV